MKCVRCGTELAEGKTQCAQCGALYIQRSEECGHNGNRVSLIWNPTKEELGELGMRCFVPYMDDRIYDIYLGGLRDGGGYDFKSKAGYTGPSLETIVLPSMVEGLPIIGIWNEFFCAGIDYAPQNYEKTFERMYPIKKIVVSEGIREAGIYAFFGCCGLETLYLPKSMKKMMYDFSDLFPNGLEPYPNGKPRGPVTVCYAGSERDWAEVAVPSLFNEYVNKGYILLQFDCSY